MECTDLPGETKLSVNSAPQEPPTTDRVTRWLLIAIGGYSVLLVSLLNLSS